MIWKEPVYQNRSIRAWLDSDSGFPAGIVEPAAEMGIRPIDTDVLGNLVRVKEHSGRENERVAKILTELAAHADLAIFLSASEVLTMITRREDHPATDLPVFPTIKQADVAVFAGLSALHYEKNEMLFDGLISNRSAQPTRVTILILPEKKAPDFPTTMSLFPKNRRINLW